MSEIKTGEGQSAFCCTELFQSDSYFGYKYPICVFPLNKFHLSLVLMSTTDKIRVVVHTVVTMKITLIFQNTTQLSFYILCSLNIHIIVL
jgi:hypothetical protein